MKTLTTDVAVIGAGPGGYVAAIRLAQLGQKVTVIERDTVGGVCLNVGCIPSKALLYAGHLYERMHHAEAMGIVAKNVSIDMPRLQAWKGQVVNKLTGGISQLFGAHGISHMTGNARFVNPTTLHVDTAEGPVTLRPKNIILATGSRPAALPGLVPDGERILDSTQALELNKLPKSLAILGGGVIGVEMATMVARLGVQVALIELMPRLLPGVDDECVALLHKTLTGRGITVQTATKLHQTDIEAKGGVRLHIGPADAEKSTDTLTADALLVSVGRKPNTDSLDIQHAGLTTDAKGHLPVDAQCRTNQPHIYAIGDVTGAPYLAHRASHMGLAAAGAIAGDKAAACDWRAMPSAVFSDPEIASVGLTEAEAKAQGLQVSIGKVPFAAIGRAWTISDGTPVGFVKIIADATTDRVLGVHMIGPEVAELIGEATLAIEMGATAEDLALTVHTHPTLPEAVMEAAEAVHRRAIHVFQPKK